MPQIGFSAGALRDLQRLRNFLGQKSPEAANRVGQVIRQGVRAVGLQAGIGRPVENMPEAFREWLVDFGSSGYVVRYCIQADEVTIQAVRHQKEAGF